MDTRAVDDLEESLVHRSVLVLLAMLLSTAAVRALIVSCMLDKVVSSRCMKLSPRVDLSIEVWEPAGGSWGGRGLAIDVALSRTGVLLAAAEVPGSMPAVPAAKAMGYTERLPPSKSKLLPR